MIDLGTQSTPDASCGLSRGNIQFPGIMDLIGESKISWFNFLVDFKAQATQCDEQGPVQMFTPFFGLKNGWIWTSNQIKNMKRRCDIVFLSEIITNSIYWQEPNVLNPPNSDLI